MIPRRLWRDGSQVDSRTTSSGSTTTCFGAGAPGPPEIWSTVRIGELYATYLRWCAGRKVHPRFPPILDHELASALDLLGTHLGPLRGVPPTGRDFRTRMTAFFFFDGERISCERVYFDQVSILTQLGLVPGRQQA